MIKFVAAEQFLVVMQTQQWLPPLSDSKALKSSRDHNEHAIRWSGDGPRPSNGAMPCSVGSHDIVVIIPEVVLL